VLWSGAATEMPASTLGKVFFVDPADGIPYVCSGTVVNTENASVVWTAGHCVHEGRGRSGRWMTNWMFVPGYHDGIEPFGRWSKRMLVSPTPWVRSMDYRFDLGAVVVRPLNGRRLADVVGAQGIAFNEDPNQPYLAFGYPEEAPFDGSKLFACSSPLAGFDTSWPTLATLRIGCDMTGGSSGGSWIAGFDGTGGYVESINSYGYPGDRDSMYGPYQGAAAESLFDYVRGR
jgi:V8-like Glu-specific endopeptidase